ncbi:MAG: serine hydrolase, partial [Xanthomonadales bacterium]|nr:serine hydrolase [Xanthomonadales bacterium]
APGGTINNEPLNTPFPVADLATLMMGISDNTATDLLHERVGRSVINNFVAASGVADPNLLTPLLGISEQFHLFYSFDLPTSLSYVNGSEAFQNNFLTTQIVPLGPSNGGPYFHVSLLTDGSWRASSFDICAAFAALRRSPGGSEAFKTVDRAMGAGVAQPNVRGQWDRAWYKGGSLSSGGAGFNVLTHAWFLEDAERDPFVVIALSNASAGGIDQFFVQSVTGRILQLVAQLP